jgi:hypothetical protein
MFVFLLLKHLPCTWPYLRISAPIFFTKPAISSYFCTVVASVAGPNGLRAQPQPSRLVRVVLQRFSLRGVGVRLLVSGLLSLCYSERILHTALAKLILAIPPHHLPSKMVHL